MRPARAVHVVWPLDAHLFQWGQSAGLLPRALLKAALSPRGKTPLLFNTFGWGGEGGWPRPPVAWIHLGLLPRCRYVARAGRVPLEALNKQSVVRVFSFYLSLVSVRCAARHRGRFSTRRSLFKDKMLTTMSARVRNSKLECFIPDQTVHFSSVTLII